MKQLKFEHRFVKDIIEGNRSSTLRIDDKNIVVGERIQLVDKSSTDKPQEWLVPGELIVVGVQKFFLSKLPRDIASNTELKTGSQDELQMFLRRFYGEHISDDTVVTLINFTYDPYEQPVPYIFKQSLKEKAPKEVLVYADGGSRGNPGPSAAGFVILDLEKNVIESWNKYLGITTNNQAEYHALIAALEWCKQHNVQKVSVYLDSLLVVNQLKGKFKVKNRDLWTLYESAKKLQGAISKIDFTHVPREMNKLADAEVNKALDAVKGSEIIQ